MVQTATSDPSKLLKRLAAHADLEELLPTTYTITNHNADTALDCDSTSDGELADVIGSLIIDLQAAGIIAGTVS